MPVAFPWLAQAANNRWCNARLLAACARLDATELHAPRPAFFGSLWATLEHLLEVDIFYLDAACGAGRPFVDRHWPDLATLTAEQTASDERLLRLCRTLEPADLGRPVVLPRSQGPVTERLDRMLQHLFLHQIHHRGQIHGLLSATAVAPPQLDEFFLAQDAPLRRAELAALGLNEADCGLPD